jgi:hypothetical protein
VAKARARGSRITGTQRAELAAQLGQRYAEGMSIRAIAEDTGRSFGFVHGLVKESGVQLRSRGGATRGPAARGVVDQHAVARGAAATAGPSAPVAPPTRDPLAGTGDAKAKAKAGADKTKAKVKAAGKAKTEVRAKDKPKATDKKSGKKGKR